MRIATLKIGLLMTLFMNSSLFGVDVQDDVIVAEGSGSESEYEVEFSEEVLRRRLNAALDRMHSPAQNERLLVRHLSFQTRSSQQEEQEYRIEWDLDDIGSLIRVPRSASRTVRATYIPRNTYEQDRTFHVFVRVIKQRLDWVARRRIERGHSLFNKDFDLEWVDVASKSQALFDWGSVAKKVLTRTLLKGQALRNEDLTFPTVIRRGQQVRVTLDRDGIVVFATVKAMQNGKVGEVIRVEYGASKKVLHAKVISDQVLEVRW